MLCGPREWAEVSEASLTPEGLTIADFDQRAQIRVVLDRCDDAEAAHEIDLFALVSDGAATDAGAGVRVMTLLTLVDDDADGVIDQEEINPFIATIPANADITLRFVARSTSLGACVSGTAEIPYRTGPPRP